MRRWLIGSLFTLMALTAYAAEPGKDFNLDCEDGKILTGIILFFILGCEFFADYRVKFRRSVKGGQPQ